MTTVSEPGAASGAPAPARATPVQLPEQSLRHDVRAVKVVWQREMIRFSQDKVRILTSLLQPLLYMFVLGTGLSSLTRGATGDVNLRTFMFPGVMAVSVLFTAMFSAVSIVWDREFGFLREMLVAPVRRGSILVGKALGGATVATIQGAFVLALAPLVGVPYAPLMVLILLVEMLVLGFSVTAFGLVLAARVKQIQSMMGLMQMVLLPLMFLSGALYPLTDLPAWLNAAVHLNPITYAVHPLRDAVFVHIDANPQAVAALNPPLTWWGWVVPSVVQVGVVVAAGLAFLAVAIWEFNRAD